MAGWTTLNASTHGCLTRACILRPVGYQVCARVVRNGTVLGGAAGERPAADVTESAWIVVITCSPRPSRALSPGHRGRPEPRSPTRDSGGPCAAGTRRPA